METIAAILGDNDFENTFRPLLESVGRALREHPGLSPAQVTSLIHMGIKFHYAAFQNHLCHAQVPSSFRKEYASTKLYLSKLKVLFDEEADAAYATKDHNGGSWHLNISTGQISSF